MLSVGERGTRTTTPVLGQHGLNTRREPLSLAAERTELDFRTDGRSPLPGRLSAHLLPRPRGRRVRSARAVPRPGRVDLCGLGPVAVLLPPSSGRAVLQRGRLRRDAAVRHRPHAHVVGLPVCLHASRRSALGRPPDRREGEPGSRQRRGCGRGRRGVRNDAVADGRTQPLRPAADRTARAFRTESPRQCHSALVARVEPPPTPAGGGRCARTAFPSPITQVTPGILA